MNIARNFIVSKDDNGSFLPSSQLLTRSSQVQILQQEEEGAFRIQVPPRPQVRSCLVLDPLAQQEAKMGGTEGGVDGGVRVRVIWFH